MKQTDRNYYRILQVQPDAPLTIINNNYRTLLHTERYHPDLGGNVHTASAINFAYTVLKNSQLRAAYDQKLFAKYKIESISTGHVKPMDFSKDIFKKNSYKQGINQRNYYRILHIQPDASEAIIRSCYKQLLKKNHKNSLIDDAYTTLTNPKTRTYYEKFLMQGAHVPLAKLKKMINQKKQDVYAHSQAQQSTIQASNFHSIQVQKYAQSVSYTCLFCRTKQKHSTVQYQTNFCISCHSPLVPTQLNPTYPRRFLERINKNSTITFFTLWPGNESIATMTDLSPLGLKFITSTKLTHQQIIKIDSKHFKAIGKIKHQNHHQKNHEIGAAFLTIHFTESMGSFIETTV